ncbi:hypothetical protein SANTM175S_05768 [Streptomyces antimycoticus]
MGCAVPRFSVIVPAYEVQPYLNDCLRSVLEQDFTDLELIAVDDHSPDACGAIIDEAAACDPRVRPVHLPENAGLGRARNAGIRRATGDYLLFLDGDDTLAPGSLRAIADRLARTGEPQVLVFDYARVDWTGEAVRNVRAELLRQGDPESAARSSATAARRVPVSRRPARAGPLAPGAVPADGRPPRCDRRRAGTAAGAGPGRVLPPGGRAPPPLPAARPTSGYTTLPYGAPRNDVFQRATEDEVARLRARLGIPAGTVAVLYAPTHRDYQRRYVPRLDLERVARALGPGFTLLVRTHYFHAPATGAASPTGRVLDVSGHGQVLDVPGHGQVLDVSGHGRVEELCLAADALLTDYSSLMFDYANLDRPIVIHADDWDAYRAARGAYFDITAAPPGPVSRTEDELIALFAGGAWCGPRSAALRAAFRARFCPYDDGRAAERVVRRVFLGERHALLPPVVPLAERRPAPAAVRALPNVPAGPAGPAGAAGPASAARPDRPAEPRTARRAGVVCAAPAAPPTASPVATPATAPTASLPHRSRPH